MSDIRAALTALKDTAKVFAPLATIGGDIDRLLAFVAHEDELKASIAAKLLEVRTHDAAMATRLADTDAEIAKRQQAQAAIEAGYVQRIARLDAKVQDAQARGEAADVAATKRIADATIRANAALATLAATHARAVAEHAAFVEETKAHRAKIESNTALMEAKLRELRNQARGALSAVAEPGSQA